MNLISSFPVRLCITLALLLCQSTQSFADPWVKAGDVRTRHHLLVLVDHGAINLPANTWPLMWNDVKTQLEAIDLAHLSEAEVWSYRYLKHALRRAMQPFSSEASFYKATNRTLTPASDTERYKSERSASLVLKSNHFALRLQGQQVQSPEGDEGTRIDGSYLAASAGNWVVGVGALGRWWGPGWHSSMSLSTHARPTESVFIQRSNSTAFPKRLPWSITAFSSRLNDDGFLPEAQINAARLSLKPLKNLELGYQELQLSAAEHQEDIHYAGFDGRLAFNLYRFQSALFFQHIERQSSEHDATQHGHVAGLEASFNVYAMHHRLVLETSKADTGFVEDFYYLGRNLGYMAGEAGKAKSLLGFHYLANGHQIEWFLTKAQTDIWPDELQYIQIAYRLPLGDNMRFSFGAMHYMDEFKLDGERIRPGNFIKLEYAF